MEPKIKFYNRQFPIIRSEFSGISQKFYFEITPKKGLYYIFNGCGELFIFNTKFDTVYMWDIYCSRFKKVEAITYWNSIRKYWEPLFLKFLSFESWCGESSYIIRYSTHRLNWLLKRKSYIYVRWPRNIEIIGKDEIDSLKKIVYDLSQNLARESINYS